MPNPTLNSPSLIATNYYVVVILEWFLWLWILPCVVRQGKIRRAGVKMLPTLSIPLCSQAVLKEPVLRALIYCICSSSVLGCFFFFLVVNFAFTHTDKNGCELSWPMACRLWSSWDTRLTLGCEVSRLKSADKSRMWNHCCAHSAKIKFYYQWVCKRLQSTYVREE